MQKQITNRESLTRWSCSGVTELGSVLTAECTAACSLPLCPLQCPSLQAVSPAQAVGPAQAVSPAQAVGPAQAVSPAQALGPAQAVSPAQASF